MIKVKRILPVNMEDGDRALFNREREVLLQGSQRVKLSRVLAFPNGFLLPANGNLAAGYSFPPRGFLGRLKMLVKWLLLRLQTKKTLEIERALWLTDEFSNGYFHWMAEVLPKIPLLGAEDRKLTLLIPAMARFAYTAETLKTWPELQYQFIEPGTRVKAKELLRVTAPGIPGNYVPDMVVRLRNELRKRWSVQGASTDKIYISRKKAARRKLVNEDAVEEVFRIRGWKTLCLEDYSWSEQAQLLCGARAIAGLHGAGLVNWLFLPTGSPVLEFRMEKDSHNNCYFSLASALDLPYYYLCCTPELQEMDIHTANLIVDPVALDRVLDAMEKVRQ